MTEPDAYTLAGVTGVLWLTRDEAAAYARVHVNTIDAWRERGMRYSGGNGEKVLIKSNWLDEWIEQRSDGDQA